MARIAARAPISSNPVCGQPPRDPSILIIPSSLGTSSTVWDLLPRFDPIGSLSGPCSEPKPREFVMFSKTGTCSVHGRHASGAPPALGAPQSRNGVSAAPNPLFYLPVDL